MQILLYIVEVNDVLIIYCTGISYVSSKAIDIIWNLEAVDIVFY